VTALRHVLVLPDRDAAEELAEDVAARFRLPGEPHLVRDALAGEDDAEDAQWLLIVEDPGGSLSPGDIAMMTRMVEAYDGWVEPE
jgi:hypothetical protein